ncbi:MAG: M42 family metallopeptidase [Firmicutes bacterium]|nr:M42 family metallopeptidase [Bacillota bacterium]
MLLKKLSEAYGVSGAESNVRELLRQELEPYAEQIRTDALGNLYITKGKGKKPRIMLTAHMDEVGLIVVGYEKSGLLRVEKVGGIDDRVLVSKPVVVGPDHIPGVIGAKPIHLQKPAERKKPLEIDKLYIDIGVCSKEEAEKLVRIGDYVAFCQQTRELGTNCLLGKAFDDRAGCAVLAELCKEDYDLELTAVFTVQEEIGLRGATVAAYNVYPDVGIVLEGTSAYDVAGITDTGYATRLGNGPAISLMDSSFIAAQKMVDFIVRTAESLGIPYQFRRLTTAGTEAGAISLAHDGIPSAVIALPCRYIHSPVSVLNLDDFHHTIRLAKGLLLAIAEGGLPLERTAEKTE